MLNKKIDTDKAKQMIKNFKRSTVAHDERPHVASVNFRGNSKEYLFLFNPDDVEIKPGVMATVLTKGSDKDNTDHANYYLKTVRVKKVYPADASRIRLDRQRMIIVGRM